MRPCQNRYLSSQTGPLLQCIPDLLCTSSSRIFLVNTCLQSSAQPQLLTSHPFMLSACHIASFQWYRLLWAFPELAHDTLQEPAAFGASSSKDSAVNRRSSSFDGWLSSGPKPPAPSKPPPPSSASSKSVPAEAAGEISDRRVCGSPALDTDGTLALLLPYLRCRTCKLCC